ncbi:hypothetical protein LOAG_13709 [Loa loa]|uniref:Uncharacterized protein n=1 Tax=Loa loa TaxID=7209 RepID=A0A1S0TJG3_LOALO|nr:hypothetical protein LOAG_13709 [Loa loa]EFO14807.1 hypothetical protein LOAG_13709 [Loa loa]
MFEILVDELKHISLTCHALNNAVCKYVLTDTSGRFAYEVADDEGVKTRRNSYAWGNLLKMCTVFWPARRRRSFMRHFYLKNKSVDDHAIWGQCFSGVSILYSLHSYDMLCLEWL